MRTNERDAQARHRITIKSDNEKTIATSKDFPNCMGLYPDCPENPSLTERNCRTCLKTDGLKKPKLEE